MKINHNPQGINGSLTALLVVTLLCLSALLFASNFRAAFPSVATTTGPQPATLGNYPNTSLPLSSNTTVTPDAPPTNTTSITVSTSTSFQGDLEGDPTTGVVRITDGHPAGTYTVTVRAFNGTGQTATTTFALTVTTPATCPQVS